MNMKAIILICILGILTVSLFAQDDSDCINRNSFSMVKTSLDVKADLRKGGRHNMHYSRNRSCCRWID